MRHKNQDAKISKLIFLKTCATIAPKRRYIKNKRGPSINPWGTTHEIFACEEHPLAVDDQMNRTKTIWIRLD